MQKFTHDGGDFCGVDAVWAEQRTAATFGALIEVVEPLFNDFFVELACANELTEELTSSGEVLTVNGAEQFCTQNRHVLWVTGTDEEVTFVSASAATYTDVHENFEGAVLCKAVLQCFIDDFFPIFREVPVFLVSRPIVWIRHAKRNHVGFLSRIAPSSWAELRL